jgi:hypothetical protein
MKMIVIRFNFWSTAVDPFLFLFLNDYNNGDNILIFSFLRNLWKGIGIHLTS